MSSDAGGGLVALVVGLAALYFIIYIIAFLLTVGAILALIALGFMSFFMAKSGNAIVRTDEFLPALFGAFAWSAALAMGLMAGSIGLYFALQYAFGGDFNAAWSARYGHPEGLAGVAVAMFDWVVADSYSFFFKVACILYFANRVYLARGGGGWRRWLGVLPPLFGFALFFGWEHYQLLFQLLTTWDPSAWRALIDTVLDEMLLPVDLLLMAIEDPGGVLRWCREALIATEGSFFKLGTYFPSLFCLVAVAIAGRHAFSSSDNAST